MKTWVKVTLVTLILGVAAMALGPILWPLVEGGAQPTPGQLFFFIVLEAIQSLAFGLGDSYPVVRTAHCASGNVSSALSR